MVRIKNRYLLVNILYPGDIPLNAPDTTSNLLSLYHPTTDQLTPQLLLKTLRTTIQDLFGDYGSGSVGGSLQVKYLSPATSTIILKVGRNHYRLVWAALSFMKSIPIREGGKPCIYQVVRVSGTIRKAEEEAIKRARAMIGRVRREVGERSDGELERLFGGTTQQQIDIGNSDEEMEEDDEED